MIRAEMEELGRVAYPVHVSDDVLTSYANLDQTCLALPGELDWLWVGNGHRRIAIAISLGHETVLTTPDVFRSGPEYAHLAGRRPLVFAPSSVAQARELHRSSPQPLGAGQDYWVQWATAQFAATGRGHLVGL